MVEEQIVGKWNFQTITYGFHSDGTFYFVDTESGDRVDGRYCIEGENIKFFANSTVSATTAKSQQAFTPYPCPASMPDRSGQGG